MTDKVISIVPTLFFYKAKGNFFDKLIRWWRNTPYSHVEIGVRQYEDGTWDCWTSSPRDGGIRMKRMAMPADTWDSLPAHGDLANVEKWFKEHDGAKYDWQGIAGFVIPFIPDAGKRYFCSESVAAALGFSTAVKFSPDMLWEITSHLMANDKYFYQLMLRRLYEKNAPEPAAQNKAIEETQGEAA